MEYTLLHKNVMCVAKTRHEGKWSCYVFPVPGLNYTEEKYLWNVQGSHVIGEIAHILFPKFRKLTYV